MKIKDIYDYARIHGIIIDVIVYDNNEIGVIVYDYADIINVFYFVEHFNRYILQYSKTRHDEIEIAIHGLKVETDTEN